MTFVAMDRKKPGHYETTWRGVLYTAKSRGVGEGRYWRVWRGRTCIGRKFATLRAARDFISASSATLSGEATQLRPQLTLAQMDALDVALKTQDVPHGRHDA